MTMLGKFATPLELGIEDSLNGTISEFEYGGDTYSLNFTPERVEKVSDFYNKECRVWDCVVSMNGKEIARVIMQDRPGFLPYGRIENNLNLPAEDANKKLLDLEHHSCDWNKFGDLDTRSDENWETTWVLRKVLEVMHLTQY